MTLNEYQQQAHKTAVYLGVRSQHPDKCVLMTDTAATYCVTALSGEAGEVANLWKKVLRGDPMDMGLVRYKLAGELGGVLWYVAELAGVLGFSLQEIADWNLQTLADRAKRGTIKGSGDDR